MCLIDIIVYGLNTLMTFEDFRPLNNYENGSDCFNQEEKVLIQPEEQICFSGWIENYCEMYDKESFCTRSKDEEEFARSPIVFRFNENSNIQ